MKNHLDKNTMDADSRNYGFVPDNLEDELFIGSALYGDLSGIRDTSFGSKERFKKRYGFVPKK